ncbi:hypothetical protein ACVWXM_001661 [Bradyrhizobium sp. GM7.3]
MRIAALLVFLSVAFGPISARADDVATAQSIIRAQEQAFGRDDARGAYSYAAPAIQEIFPAPDIFMSMVQNGYPPVYRHKSFEFVAAARARAAGLPSTSISSMPMARPGKRSTRWSSNRTAATRSRVVRC